MAFSSTCLLFAFMEIGGNVGREGIFDPSLQHVKRYGGIYQGGIQREIVWAASDSDLFFFFFIFHL